MSHSIGDELREHAQRGDALGAIASKYPLATLRDRRHGPWWEAEGEVQVNRLDALVAGDKVVFVVSDDACGIPVSPTPGSMSAHLLLDDLRKLDPELHARLVRFVADRAVKWSGL